MILHSNRSGKVIETEKGYKSFIPNPLPPNPKIEIDDEMQSLLSSADNELGRLDGIATILPNPDLFIGMYVRKEAVLSSQIEGTQASLVDILTPPANSLSEAKKSIEEIINYVDAMHFGLERLKTLPLSLRLIREIHAILLKKGRGSEKEPGEFRRSQNWVGLTGCDLNNATYIPPTVEEMNKAMADLENYFYNETYIPPLIKIALIHAQFETIHPFLDGNGRIGRLLITFWLCQQKILSKPLLYLSYYFKQNRDEYYSKLMDVRFKGHWEQWIKFFLNGVAITAKEARTSATEILKLKERYTALLNKFSTNTTSYIRMLNYLFEYPIITRKSLEEKLKISSPTAGELIKSYIELGLLEDITPQKARKKEYCFTEYFNILKKGTELLAK